MIGGRAAALLLRGIREGFLKRSLTVLSS